MRSVAAALTVALALVAASCGGDGGAPTGTQTATQTIVASPSPGGAGPVPPRPSSFEDYPAAIASYLDKKGEPEPLPQGTLWTCPMHPEIVQEGPGHCPICGMGLEPMGVPSEHDHGCRGARSDDHRGWVGFFERADRRAHGFEKPRGAR